MKPTAERVRLLRYAAKQIDDRTTLDENELLRMADELERELPKPPLELWVNVYRADFFSTTAYSTKERADNAVDAEERIRCVHMREVTDEN